MSERKINERGQIKRKKEKRKKRKTCRERPKSAPYIRLKI